MSSPDVTLERTRLAERHVARVRMAVVAFNSLVYLALMSREGTLPGLAYAIIVAASLYSVAVLVLEPYARLPVLGSSRFTTVSDALLISLWIAATGGMASPFFVLWYVSLAAVAYRYDGRATLVAAGAYALAYAGVVAALDPAALRSADLLVRIAYIGFVGVLGALVSQDAVGQITHRVTLNERMRAVETAEAKFRGLLEAAPDPIVIVDRAGRIVLVNTQAEHVFGYGRQEMLGQPVETLLPDTVRRAHEHHRSDYMHEPHTRPMGVGLDLHGRRRDGSTFPVEISLSPMQTAEGTLVTSIVRDITDRRRAEEERLTSLERLKELERLRELDRFKTTFINTAAHELGTPLTPIKLQLHILRSGGSDGLAPRQVRALDILDRNVDRLAHLVQEVLNVARLQAGRLGVEKEPVDVNRLASEAVESFQEPARERGIRLDLRMAPALVADADPKRLTQVLLNLLNNAWKFTPTGGRISVETARENDMAVVRVRDTGAGIKPEDIQKLFQPFSQVHDTMQKTAPGTGLGLYICKGILDLHQGRIWAESQGPGLGSTFAFAVPLSPQAVSLEERPEGEPAPADRIARRARELI